MAAARKRTKAGTPPRQERSHDTVAVILEATERVAYKVGFEAARTTAIAKQAGVSIGTLYRYFPSKEALLKALTRHRWSEGLRWLGERMAVIDPGPFDVVVEEVVKIAFEMVANQMEALGQMQIETEHAVHVDLDYVEGAAKLVQGGLEQQRSDLATQDLEVASLLVVRTVVFLARVGVRDHADLIQSGRYANEVARMIGRYLARPSSAVPGRSEI